MKKRLVLIILLVALVCAGSANANIFRDFWGSITGMVTGEPVSVNEQVKCVFSGSDTEQTCYTGDGKFKCPGTGSCTVDVSGGEGTKLDWKSSCGSYASTIIDGNNDIIEFRCVTTTTTTTLLTSSVNEKVTCVFTGSGAAQHCYTDDGRFKCSGTASCTADVSGGQGTKLNWKSSCGGYASTILDGVDDSIGFSCQTTTTIITTMPASYAKEQVKCVFINSVNSETCFTWDGKFKCAGVGSCVADVSGFQGYTVEWKSSCGSKEQYTVFDGTGETITFVCPTLNTATTAQATEAAPKPVTEVPAQYVSCAAGCSCMSEERAKEAGWEPCGGPSCEQGARYCYKPAPITTTTLPQGTVKLHFLYWRENCPLCDSERQFLEKMKQKYPQMQYVTYDASPPGGAQYALAVMAFLEEGRPTLFFDNKIWEGYSDSIAQEIEDKIKYCLENACSRDPSFDPKIAYARIEKKYNITDVEKRMASPLKPSMATPPQHNATATPEGPITEKVQCIFLDSDVLVNPHTAKKEQCYSEKFGCTWDGMVASEPSISEKYAFCYAEATGERGENIVWKSSCGGYSTTVIDGNPDKATFQCVPSADVTQEQIRGKGFNKAYWQCYDGEEQTSSAQCLSSEGWQEHASKFCSGHCKTYDTEGITKCGVNSFSVSDECYYEQAQQVTAAQPPQNILAPVQTTQQTTQAGGASSQTTPSSEKKIAMPPDSQIGQVMLLYFYFNGCPHCVGMDAELDKAASQLGIDTKKIDTNSERDLAEGYKVFGVPTLILLKYDTSGIKEYMRGGKADAATIVEWVNGITSGGGASEKTAEAPKEEMLICKDSCPSEGKCYPFGYRKGSEFCSDSGAFIAQLGDNAKCDNSFECKTNLCVDGECVGHGILQKFMNWFKKLFG